MAQLCGVYDFYNQSLFADVQDVYIISDTHFNEPDLQIAFPQRINHEELIKRINSKCGRSSALIHLGDVGDISYIPQLRAKIKILIQGNHDGGAEKYKRKCLTEEFDAKVYTKEAILSIAKEKYPNWEYHIYKACDCRYQSSEKWILNVDNKMFDYVFQGPVILGEKLILSHEPIYFAMDFPFFNIHGHVHSPNNEGIFHKNVCCDVCNYEPFHLNSFLKNGGLKQIKSIHRQTIDKAIERKKK